MLNQFVIEHVNANTPGEYYLYGFVTAMLSVAIVAAIYSIAMAAVLIRQIDRQVRHDSAPRPTYWQVLSADVKTVTDPFVGAFLWVVIGPVAVGNRMAGVKRASLMAARLSTAILSRLFAVVLIAGITHQIGGRK